MPSLESPLLRISTPIEPTVPGRGFYQLEEDQLYVQVGLFSIDRPWFSCLESEVATLDMDRDGRLMFVTVKTPRRRWQVDPDLKLPPVAEPADIRWLDFREKMPSPKLIANPRLTMLQLFFTPGDNFRTFSLAQNVLAQIDDNNRLTAIWVNDIVDDLAGQEIARFRRQMRSE